MSSATERLLGADSAEALAHRPCSRCGFELWSPVWALSVSEVGLYDDARFPGRLIVSLGDHFDHLDEVPDDLLTAFMADVATASRNLRFSLHVDRVNVAVLGNQESHVHAHLVPRLHSAEPLPHSAPWQDPRPRARLADEDRREMITLLRAAAPW